MQMITLVLKLGWHQFRLLPSKSNYWIRITCPSDPLLDVSSCSLGVFFILLHYLRFPKLPPNTLCVPVMRQWRITAPHPLLTLTWRHSASLVMCVCVCVILFLIPGKQKNQPITLQQFVYGNEAINLVLLSCSYSLAQSRTHCLFCFCG